MRSGFLLLAALLSAAAAPEGERFDAAAALRSVLPAGQAAALSGQSDLDALAKSLDPEQRAAAGAKLREAEGRTKDPRDLAAIHKGYLALKDAEGAGRVGDAVVARFPQASAGYVMRGQAAELRGDMSGAVEQAQEALRRDPRDKAAFALLKLSEGRASTSGSAGASPPPNELDFDSPSALSDPRVVEAGRRATDHVQAVKSLDEAMTRLRARDPQEALRLLARAEALDGTMPDIPMQMGLAHRALERHAVAIGHFARAEEMWRARGGERDMELAGMALSLKADSEARLAQPPQGGSRPARPRDHFPLLPIAAGGLGITALGVLRSRRTREDENGVNPSPEVGEEQARANYINSAVYIGIPAVLILGALAGPAIVARAVPAGATLWRNASVTTQRIITSEAGMVHPSGLSAEANSVWTSTSKRSALQNALKHFADHGSEFPELKTADAYVASARAFVMRPPVGTLIKMRGTDRIFYNPRMNTFAVQAENGRIRTMFKPSPAIHGYATNLEYFHAQR